MHKLLIVEDDPDVQKQLKASFDECGVIAATDRASALNAKWRHEPAVVLRNAGLEEQIPALFQRHGLSRGALQYVTYRTSHWRQWPTLNDVL